MGVWTNVTASMDLLDTMNIDIYCSHLNPLSNWKPLITDDGLIYDEWNVGLTKVERLDSSYHFGKSTSVNFLASQTFGFTSV